MPTIDINIARKDVFIEVMKATDYTGTKLIYEDEKAREKFYATEADLQTLSRFWTEAAESFNERLKPMLESATTDDEGYKAKLEVSVNFDTALSSSVVKTTQSFFIAFIIGQWFKLSKKDEASGYLEEADEDLTNVERLLYSRKRPQVPTD